MMSNDKSLTPKTTPASSLGNQSMPTSFPHGGGRGERGEVNTQCPVFCLLKFSIQCQCGETMQCPPVCRLALRNKEKGPVGGKVLGRIPKTREKRKIKENKKTAKYLVRFLHVGLSIQRPELLGKCDECRDRSLYNRIAQKNRHREDARAGVCGGLSSPRVSE